MKAAVILSGCGFLDGAEITESVLSYLVLSQKGIAYQSFAPNREMHPVISHLTKQEQKGAHRNILEEAARIARGEIRDLNQLNPDEFDLLWMPGGNGLARQLSDFDAKGATCSVDPVLETIIRAFYEKKKPIVGVCVAPAILGRALQGKGIKMTLGKSKSNSDVLRQMGMEPVPIGSDSMVYDEIHQIYTTPAFIEPSDPAGIYKALQAIGESLLKTKKTASPGKALLLREERCVPCMVGGSPLPKVEVERLRKELAPDWTVEEDKSLHRKYTFRNFKEALSFTTQVGRIAEEEGHHPDITLGWGYVEVTLRTHKIDGLSRSDFILADKIEAEHQSY